MARPNDDLGVKAYQINKRVNNQSTFEQTTKLMGISDPSKWRSKKKKGNERIAKN